LQQEIDVKKDTKEIDKAMQEGLELDLEDLDVGDSDD
jgi:hypothetical protein